MIRRKVFIPNKKLINEKKIYFSKRRAKLKRFRSKYYFYLRNKYFRIKIFNNKFLYKKIRFLRYYYFILNFIRKKFFAKFKYSKFLRKFKFNYIFFKFRRRFFSNFFYFKNFNIKKSSIFLKTGFKNRISYKRSRFLFKRFGIISKLRGFSYGKRYRNLVNTKKKFGRFPIFHKKKRPNFHKKNWRFTSKRKFFRRIVTKSKHKHFFSSKKNAYISFKSNFKSFKRAGKRYEKKFFRFVYFFKFKRKVFRRTYNHRFWRRFFIVRFTRYFLASKLKAFFKRDFNTFHTTYFYKRKNFFPYSFFLRSFKKFFFKNRSLRRKFKKKLAFIYSRKRTIPFFNNKFLFESKNSSLSTFSRSKDNLIYINSSIIKNFKKSWFFRSTFFKYTRYIDFCRFHKFNYFKKFIFFNKKKFKLVYSNLLSFSKAFRSFKMFKFAFLLKKKKIISKNKFSKLRNSRFFFKKRPFNSSTFLGSYSASSSIFSRNIFSHFFANFFSPLNNYFNIYKRKSSVFSNRYKKFRFFAFKKFFHRRNKSFFGFKKNKYNNRKNFRKFKRKYNKKINAVKFSRSTLVKKRKKSYFYKFFRRLSLFFKRRSSNPFPFRSRANFNKNTFTLNHFFFSSFLSRNLFYYNSNKFFRQFHFFRRRHKLYCSALSARFRKLYRLRNRFKRKRRKFLRKIRFNFFISNHHAKRNYDNFNKEKNFVSLFHTKNNFFIYVHNVNGKIIYQSTNGMAGYRGPKKPTAFAAEINARRVAKAIKHSKIFPIVLVIRTRLSSFVRSAIRGINYMGLKFSYVKRMILKGHNGLRKPGLRRT